MARLRDAGANTAERAIVMDRQGLLTGFVHRRLERAGVLQPAPNDRYYLNETANHAFQAGRRRRAIGVLSFLVAALAVMYFGGYFS